MNDRMTLVGAALFVAACGSEVRPTSSRQPASAALATNGARLCDSGRFPSNLGPASACCQDGNRTWHIQPLSNALVYRVYGDPCREADGVGTNCGQGSDPFQPCTFGACGAKNEWVIHAADMRVFVPDSMPQKCGWAATGITSCAKSDGELCDWEVKGTRSFPEAYSGQAEYPGVAGTCPYTRCRVGGTPF